MLLKTQVHWCNQSTRLESDFKAVSTLELLSNGNAVSCMWSWDLRQAGDDAAVWLACDVQLTKTTKITNLPFLRILRHSYS